MVRFSPLEPIFAPSSQGEVAMRKELSACAKYGRLITADFADRERRFHLMVSARFI